MGGSEGTAGKAEERGEESIFSPDRSTWKPDPLHLSIWRSELHRLSNCGLCHGLIRKGLHLHSLGYLVLSPIRR